MVVKPAGTFLKAIALLSMLIPGVLMAETTAKLDRETIYLDQTVRLVIETDQNESANFKPDLSALEANFNILGSSSSQNISYVNGTQTSLKSWLTELEPKAAGSYTIPAVAVGNERTNALRLTVLPVDNSATSSNRDIYVELEAEGSRFYVQQQINLTIRLYLGVNLIDGTLSEPEPVDAIVRRLGNRRPVPDQSRKQDISGS